MKALFYLADQSEIEPETIYLQSFRARFFMTCDGLPFA